MGASESLEVLAGCPLLQPLPPEALEDLSSSSIRRRYGPGEALFRTGDPGQWLFVIASGQVQAVARGARGQELILHVAGPGETPGAIDLLDGGRRSVDATAVAAVEVVAIPVRMLRKVMLAHPEALMRLAEELASIIRALSQSAQDLAMLPLPARIAKLLLTLPEADSIVTFNSTQSEMAARLGVVRQSFSRTLGDLQSRGLIRIVPGGKAVELVDRIGLAELERQLP